MDLVLLLLLSIIVSWGLTFLVRKIAIKRCIIDVPNSRSSHEIPTPRGGGLAIALVWFLAVVFLHRWGRIETDLFYAFLSGLILVVISFIDDILNISYSIRLIFQVICISAGLYFIGGLGTVNFGFFHLEQTVLLTILAGLALLWFINLFNFIDGIDGYAAVEAIFLSVAIFIFSGNHFVLILGAATLGYLYWNFGKKKIFMGDVGSTLLGYTLGIFAIYENNLGEIPIFVFVILSSVFWFDATLTLIRRIRNRENITKAHKKHAYQRIVQYGYSHRKTVIFLFFLNVILLGLAWIAFACYKLIIPAFVINILFLYFINRKIDRKMPFPVN